MPLGVCVCECVYDNMLVKMRQCLKDVKGQEMIYLCYNLKK